MMGVPSGNLQMIESARAALGRPMMGAEVPPPESLTVPEQVSTPPDAPTAAGQGVPATEGPPEGPTEGPPEGPTEPKEDLTHPPRGPYGTQRGPSAPPRGPYGTQRGAYAPPRGPYGTQRGPSAPPRGPYGDPRGDAPPVLSRAPVWDKTSGQRTAIRTARAIRYGLWPARKAGARCLSE